MICQVSPWLFTGDKTGDKIQETRGRSACCAHFMADLPVVFSFMVRCGLEAHVRYKKELSKLLSSFDVRCGPMPGGCRPKKELSKLLSSFDVRCGPMPGGCRPKAASGRYMAFLMSTRKKRSPGGMPGTDLPIPLSRSTAPRRTPAGTTTR